MGALFHLPVVASERSDSVTPRQRHVVLWSLEKASGGSHEITIEPNSDIGPRVRLGGRWKGITQVGWQLLPPWGVLQCPPEHAHSLHREYFDNN